MKKEITIGVLARPVPAFRSQTLTCQQADNIFRKDPALTHLVIIDDQLRPTGLLTKNYFYDRTGGQFGFSLFATKKVETIAISSLLTVEAAIAIPDAARLSMRREQNIRYDPVVITDNGKFIGTVSISDLLERFQDELIMRNELVEQANRGKSVFLANMSHEIRTPLNAIIGFAEVLDSELSDPEHRRYLSYIRNAGNVLLNLISDILDLSRIDSGKLAIKCEKIVIADILNEIYNMFQWKAQCKNLELIFETGEVLAGTVMLDGLRLRQILINLVGNAIKFTDAGFVKVRAFTVSDRIIFEVEDTGIGIQKDQHERIFDAFTQCDGQDTAKYGGTGLGLTITRQLAQLMDGDITLISEPGRGSIFTVELPLHIVAGHAALTSTVTHEGPIYCLRGSVLIVDDVEFNRILLKALLKKHDLTIYEAVDGINAIEVAGRALPDIILMDIKMPGMDGYAATKEIRLLHNLKNVPVIAMSAASPEPKYLQEALFQEYIMKPFRPRQVYEMLSRHLKNLKSAQKQLQATAEHAYC